MGRPIDWEGDRRFRLPGEPAAPPVRRWETKGWDPAFVAQRSGVPRKLSAKEIAALAYRAPRAPLAGPGGEKPLKRVRRESTGK